MEVTNVADLGSQARKSSHQGEKGSLQHLVWRTLILSWRAMPNFLLMPGGLAVLMTSGLAR